uniref:Uncharacterized protein n=1 Tax=Anguilla anguilla TaxID=7936 RepID=A0A0E9XG78_ANGAN
MNTANLINTIFFHENCQTVKKFSDRINSCILKHNILHNYE